MELYRRIDRYWNTVRHLRPSQLVSRADLRLRAAARTLSPDRTRARYAARAARAGLTFNENPWNLRGSASLSADLIAPATRAAAQRDAAGAVRGVFEFLNDRRDLGAPVDWAAVEAPQLWRYHLHYFDYAADLTVSGATNVVSSLIIDWIQRVRMAEAATRDAWHPYVVSLRIVNWFIALATSPHDSSPPDGIVESLRVQTLFVRDNLETDVGGNHLLKNLKALAIAGCFWTGKKARQMREHFTDEFIRTLESQLRSDGGHYEQSPMYHAQVLGDAIELALVLRQVGSGRSDLENAIARMAKFLVRVCHPDGQLVQFGDTAAGMAPEPDALVAACGVLTGRDPDRRLIPRHALLAGNLALELRRARSADGTGAIIEATTNDRVQSAWDPQASGFISLATSDGRRFLIADAGPVCPDDLPAHAHSDLFGFEVSVDGVRLVVDSGVSEYASGPWRDYYRSTRAHSTVMVDGVEQSECWGSFRVGRRAHVVDGCFESTTRARGFYAAHTGFDHLSSPVRHRRRFLLVAERFWLVIDDLVGHATHRWETFLHLHPDAELEERASGFVARRSAATLGIVPFGIEVSQRVSGQKDPLQGWYAPAFGCVVPSPTLVAAGSGPLPVRFGWLLVPDARADQELRVRTADPDTVIVDVATETFVIGLGALRKH
jgi:uncharacterized heparinase superfamily protein